MKPLCIELFAGTMSWSAGWLELGGYAVGFDIEHLPHHGPVPRGADLVLQDVATLHGSQFKDASLILASPPCPEFSYMAMPWSRGKQIRAALQGRGEFPEGYQGSRTVDELTALFRACFRIQREACEAAGHHIPMVVENVRGAQPWVGRSAWNFGSFHLWGNVPALMPIISKRGVMKSGVTDRNEGTTNFHGGRKNSGGSWFAVAHNTTSGAGNNPRDAITREFGFPSETDPHGPLARDGRKVAMNFHEHEKTGKPGRSFQSVSVEYSGVKCTTGSATLFRDRTEGNHWSSRHDHDEHGREKGSRKSARKAASALIAKIPLALSQHIASVYYPR